MVNVTEQHVEFCFYRPQAGFVEIVGEFNGWRHGDLPMHRGTDGHWHAKIDLPAGVYRFRYRADGEWFTDYAAFGLEPGEFGMDSILRVAETPETAAQAGPALPARQSA